MGGRGRKATELAHLSLLAWLAAACVPLFLTPRVAAAADRVVLLLERGASIYQRAAVGFKQGFAGAGELVEIGLSGDPGDLEARLTALRRDPPRLLVTIGSARAALIAREKLPGVPILYCLALNPVENKLVGDNIGGVAFDLALSEQLASIQKALPEVRRIGVIYDEMVSGQVVREAKRYLNPGVHLKTQAASTPREAARAIEQLGSAVDAFWMLMDPVIANPANFNLLLEFSLKNRVPLICPAVPFVEAGALLSVSANYLEVGRRTGRMAREVWEGKARPGDFGAETPKEPLLTLNETVARRLRITLAGDVRADILSPP